MFNFKIIEDKGNTGRVGQFIHKHKLLCFFIVFALQLALNLYKISDIGLWHDEAFTVNTAIKSITGIVEVSQSDVNPPLYPVVVHYWIKCFGISEFSLRLLSAIAVALASAFLFRFCLRFLNWQAAIFTFMMFFTNYVFFYYAQEARTYSLVLLFVVLSNYLFFLIMDETRMKKSIGLAVLLGIVNICLFYFHFLSCFALIGQAILFPLFAVGMANTEMGNKIKLKTHFVRSYFLSWLVFFVLLLPFYKRFLSLVQEGGDMKMWLQKPVYDDLKRCIYEMFTTKEVYQLYVYSAVVIVVLLVFRKLRDDHFKLKILLFAIISGPGMLYLNYMAASYSPIFLLRYVLFTFIGFILVYCYLLSVLNIKFEYKLVFFLILVGYSFTKVKIPKEINQDYKNAMKYLKSVKKENTLISTDLPEVFSYYYDKDIFYITDDRKKVEALKANHIYAQISLTWPDSLDFTHVKDIYYTQSFEYYNDGNRVVFTKLSERFNYVEQIEKFKGVHIAHFTNKDYKD